MTVNHALPKVTICVPVRNGARTIQRTLNSLLSQDYPNYEIIVSDNCSNDDTAKIIGEYAAKGIKYYFNPVLEKWGGEANWNYILSLAEGPFIALYHADDIYSPTIVRKQVEFLLSYPAASAVFTLSKTINEHDQDIKNILKLPNELKGKNLFKYEEFLNYTLKYGTIVPVPTMMSRRNIISRVGVFNWGKYATAADIDLYFRMAQCGVIGLINEELHKYRIGSQNTAEVFHKRTFLGHYFYVMDDYLKQPEIIRMVKQDILSIYKARRAADEIRCALNMINLGFKGDGIAAINRSLTLRYAIESLKMAIHDQPKAFLYHIIGYILIISSHLGIESIMGKKIYKVIEDYIRRRRKTT
jgi:glycosyltransferase involved in cell wall biosynthesis